MARDCVADAVRRALEEMGVVVVVDTARRHPQLRWCDGELTGVLHVPGTPGDHRSLLNNVKMAQRLVRQARAQRQEK